MGGRSPYRWPPSASGGPSQGPTLGTPGGQIPGSPVIPAQPVGYFDPVRGGPNPLQAPPVATPYAAPVAPSSGELQSYVGGYAAPQPSALPPWVSLPYLPYEGAGPLIDPRMQRLVRRELEAGERGG